MTPNTMAPEITLVCFVSPWKSEKSAYTPMIIKTRFHTLKNML